MKIFNAADFGIVPNEDISEKLAEFISALKDEDGEKTAVFDSGTYYIDSERCKEYMLVITNTAGEKEFSPDETPHLNAVPFYFGGISNLVFDGGDSVFVIDGKVTNIAVEDCRNITLRNLEIRHAHPDMHEFSVVRKSAFSVDFKIDSDSSFSVENGKLVFSGHGYKNCCDMSSVNAGWIGLIREKTPEKVKRVMHPLFSSLSVRDMGGGVIRAKYLNTSRFTLGDRFYYYDVRRQFAGIFINRSENITLENIKQRFNYSLALVAQDSENLTVDSVDFSPEQGSARLLASVADFIQLCMCRGLMTVKNSYFSGAGDDCLNVHGVHFKIVDISGRDMTVRFMHPQTYGFDPLRVGDTVAFINPDTMLEKGQAVIEKSELVNNYDIKLTLSSADGAQVGMAIEDISACPDLDFVGNTLTRIITRGLLITTRGKVNVKNNHFVSTTMSGILLSDDAKNWYESGMCHDVTIENNVFDYCGETPILIKPENSRYEGAVHKNIKIIGNEFKSYKGCCISAKATDDILVENNEFSGEKIKTQNCNNINVR